MYEVCVVIKMCFKEKMQFFNTMGSYCAAGFSQIPTKSRLPFSAVMP